MVWWLSLAGIVAYFGFAVLVGKMLAFSGGEKLPPGVSLHQAAEPASAHNDRDAPFFARERA
jgi:hypothetical protein